MILTARITSLRRWRDHYAVREAEPYVVRDDGRDHRNPWTGLRRATERVLAKLEAEEGSACCSDLPSETSDERSAARSAEVG